MQKSQTTSTAGFPVCRTLSDYLDAIQWPTKRLKISSGFEKLESAIDGRIEMPADVRDRICKILGKDESEIFPEYRPLDPAVIYPPCRTLERYLHQIGWSKNKLALAAQIQYPNLCNAIKGKRRMPQSAFDGVCRALKKPAHELFPEYFSQDIIGRQYSQVLPIGILKLSPPSDALSLYFQLIGSGGVYLTLDGSTPSEKHGFYFPEGYRGSIDVTPGTDLALLREQQGSRITFVWRR